MLFMPPGSAKSTYGSVRGPSYYLGRQPEKNVISASYGENLATSFGRKTRNLIDTKEYQAVFPNVQLTEDSRAKGEWETSQGGSYYACGVGSGVTGRRADLGIIDDPVKGRKEADSQLVRDTAWDWYLSDFLTRLKPGAAQLIIQTRWHEDDLSGRLLPEKWDGESGPIQCRDGNEWLVICLKAQAGKNDPLGRKLNEWLWLDWFDEAFWEETKRAQSGKDIRNWHSLYQQTPKPDEGIHFKRDWFKRYELGKYPDVVKYGCSDFATTEDSGDFTDQGVGGFDENLDLWLVDWWYGQTETDVWVEELLTLAKRHDVYLWAAEKGVIDKSVGPWLKREMRESNRNVRIEKISHGNKDKLSNCRSFQALAAQRKVHIPLCEWGDRVIDQLCNFPGKYDDAFDVCGLFGKILNKTYGPSEVIAATKQTRDAYGMDDEDDHDDTWKVA
jgi:predicted phage terminase large subunit-like protein